MSPTERRNRRCHRWALTADQRLRGPAEDPRTWYHGSIRLRSRSGSSRQFHESSKLRLGPGHLVDRHVHVAASLYHDIAPCGELGIPAVWVNRAAERSELRRAGELPDCRQLAETLDRIVGR